MSFIVAGGFMAHYGHPVTLRGYYSSRGEAVASGLQDHLYSSDNTSAIHAKKNKKKLSTSSLVTPRCYSCPLSPVSPQIMHSARRHSSPRLSPGWLRYCSAAASNKPRSCQAERVLNQQQRWFPSSLQLGESGVWRPSRLP